MALKINGTTVVDDSRNASFTGLSATLPSTINTTSTSAALTITQLGTGNALVVEDAASDTTPFVVDQSGNVSVGGTLAVTGNTTITGDLVVNGTTTTVNSTTYSVDDPNITIGAVTTPTDVTADGGGITLKGTTDKTINWVAATSRWTSNQGFEVPNFVYTGTLTGSTGILNIGAGQVYKDATGKFGLNTTTPAVALDIQTTDAMRVPVGTTGQRPTGSTGYLRYNTTTSKFEGYSSGNWTSVGGGATGTGIDAIFIENDQIVTQSYTISAGKNAGTFGPVTVADGAVVTIPNGSVWSIV